MSNTIHVVGNTTRDFELRYTTGGRAVASAGIASNRRYQVNGEWQEEVSFFNVICWGELGEHAAECLTKGSRVIVLGRMQQRSWENSDGEKRTVLELVAESIGPDLRWATAEIKRIDRQHSDQPPQQQRQQERAPDPIYGDEEPF